MHTAIKFTSKQTYPLKMKALILVGTALTMASTLKENLFPNIHLAVILGIAISTDFCSGIMKSIATGQPIVSKKLQRTSIKISRYGFAVIVSLILRSIAVDKGGGWAILGDMLNDGLLFLLIYTEIVSVLENIIAMDGADVLSMKVAKPLHAFLTFKFHDGITDLLYNKYEQNKKDKQDK